MLIFTLEAHRQIAGSGACSAGNTVGRLCWYHGRLFLFASKERIIIGFREVRKENKALFDRYFRAQRFTDSKKIGKPLKIGGMESLMPDVFQKYAAVLKK